MKKIIKKDIKKTQTLSSKITQDDSLKQKKANLSLRSRSMTEIVTEPKIITSYDELCKKLEELIN